MRYEDMCAADLREELNLWQTKALNLAREFLDARDSGDIVWEAGIGIALRQALAQVKRIERYLRLGVAA